MFVPGDCAVCAGVLEGVEATVLRPLGAGSVLADVDRGKVSRVFSFIRRLCNGFLGIAAALSAYLCTSLMVAAYCALSLSVLWIAQAQERHGPRAQSVAAALKDSGLTFHSFSLEFLVGMVDT